MLPEWCHLVLSTSVSPLIRIVLFYIFVCCQNFCPILIDRYHVLKMGGGLLVLCADRPSVGLLNYTLCSHIDHRFNREYHPRHNLHSLSPLSVIRNFRVFMKVFSNTVSHQFANHPVSKFLHVGLDRKANVADPVPRFCLFNAGEKRFIRPVQQVQHFGTRLR